MLPILHIGGVTGVRLHVYQINRTEAINTRGKSLAQEVQFQAAITPTHRRVIVLLLLLLFTHSTQSSTIQNTRSVRLALHWKSLLCNKKKTSAPCSRWQSAGRYQPGICSPGGWSHHPPSWMLQYKIKNLFNACMGGRGRGVTTVTIAIINININIFHHHLEQRRVCWSDSDWVDLAGASAAASKNPTVPQSIAHLTHYTLSTFA